MCADTSLWGREEIVDGKTGGLMSWSKEKNEGWKDGDGGCGADLFCSDPAPA